MSALVERSKVLAGGVFALILAMGVARFAYTPLLPLMQRQAGLGITEAGLLAAVNYAGYLTGAVVTSLISSQRLKVRLYIIGLVLTVMTTAMMGWTTNVWLWCLSRYLAGVGTAAGMLLGSGLILNWLTRHKHRSELGIHFSGVGLGIAVCSLAVALMTPALDWRQQWYALTVLGALLLIPALLWMPDSGSPSITTSSTLPPDRPPTAMFLGIFMAAYFCAGIGYVVSATFIVSIIDGLPDMHGRGTMVFLLIGVAGAPSCVLWDLLARKTGDLNAVMLASLLQIVGIILPIVPGGLAAALVGSILFGATVMGLVSLVLTMAGRYYPGHPGKMMGKMSIAYGSAQIVGPAVTGWLARGGGSYAAGLYMASGMMAIGLVLLLVLKTMEKRSPSYASAVTRA
jgi:predicted MFS family arabinose efflux permease